MQLRYNFRVYPTPGQQVSLARAFGCARVVYNDGLRLRQQARAAGLPYIKNTALQTLVVTQAKKTLERQWLAEVSNVVLVQALRDLHNAYRNFFASVTGRRQGAKLGLSTFAVLSNGKTITSPRFFQHAERRLRKAQQALSRKEKGSRNRAKARVKVAAIHVRVADMRRDWAHKHSTRIIRDNQAVYLEHLSVKGLARTRFAKSVLDAGWGMFIRLLEEKAQRYGRTFGKVDRFFPPTRMCSVCGAVGDKKPLHVRSWTCTCGITHDRDVNAAINILAAGRADRLNACGGTVSPAA